MKTYSRGILLLVTLISISSTLKGGDCFYSPKPLKQVLEENKNRDIVYFQAIILGQNRFVVPVAGYEALNIKIEKYWGKTLQLTSDTLCIMGNASCALELKKGSEYLLALQYNNYYYSDGWSGTDSLPKYEDEMDLLGPAKYIVPKVEKNETEHARASKKTDKDKKQGNNTLLIWLLVSVGLNFFAILLIVLLKREKGWEEGITINEKGPGKRGDG